MSKFELPDLPYAYDALEPHMSSRTLEFHHDKHHQAYVDNTNALLEKSDLKGQDLEDIVVKSHNKNQALFNNAAQHFNHTQFWRWMSPKGGGAIPGKLEKALTAKFKSLEDFKKTFKDTGVGQFGSGWVWLMWKGGGLDVISTPNGENPLVHGGRPLLGCDVWEHSYYLDYQNRRAAYLDAFLENLVDWEAVAAGFEKCG